MNALWISQVVAAAWLDVSFACVVGAVLSGIWLRAATRAAGSSPGPARTALARTHSFGVGSAVAWLVAGLLNLWLQAAAMSGLPLEGTGAAIWPVLSQSHFGLAWAVGFGAALVLTLAIAPSNAFERRPALAVALFAAALAAYARAATGHAADAGNFALPEWVQALHVASTATWAGLLVVSALVVLPSLGGTAARGALIGFVTRLSRGAGIAVVLLVGSGIFNAMRGLGDTWGPLTESQWGKILLVKLALVALALLLGGMNRFGVLPRLRRAASTDAARACNRLIRFEAIVLIAVLCAAAALAHSAPGVQLGT